MSDYKTIKNDLRKASAYQMGIAYLAVLPQPVLAILDLPNDVLSAVASKRMDDDYVGQAASMAAFAFSNNTNTASDRFVAAQIFALSIGCIMRAKPMTLDLVDNMKKDRVKDIIAESFNMLPPVGAGVRISGDAVAEELHRLCEKAEQYNRYLLVDEKTQADFADVKEEEVGTIGDKIRGIYESVKFW